ncbi:hypothetical protein AAE02nite_24600 [Adhaeribacter aerolatus]|uniref:Uncharacterized protein n=1 Tax=Adhaeribacter aerolatus TaxID=670289 RepID=A0A512AYL6_9BACT|nr:cupin domain-containing protein [Adhaeribacter aerolatus]GEO04796.1 hypothetical protein AAE02nite_24600 [Adhaeribacter aerolatus]
MTTISDALNKFKQEGYTVEFSLNDNCLVCRDSSLEIYPDEFLVESYFRFDGILDPEDEVLVYAISSNKRQVKGTLINVYGVYSENTTDEMVRALNANIPLKRPKKAIPAAEETDTSNSGESYGLEKHLTVINLPALKDQIKQRQTWKFKDRNAMTLCKRDNIRLVLVALASQAQMKTHRAVTIVSLQVLEGKLKVSTEKQTVELAAGQVLALTAGIPHHIFADEESIFLLTMIPGKKND